MESNCDRREVEVTDANIYWKKHFTLPGIPELKLPRNLPQVFVDASYPDDQKNEEKKVYIFGYCCGFLSLDLGKQKELITNAVVFALNGMRGKISNRLKELNLKLSELVMKKDALNKRISTLFHQEKKVEEEPSKENFTASIFYRSECKERNKFIKIIAKWFPEINKINPIKFSIPLMFHYISLFILIGFEVSLSLGVMTMLFGDPKNSTEQVVQVFGSFFFPVLFLAIEYVSVFYKKSEKSYKLTKWIQITLLLLLIVVLLASISSLRLADRNRAAQEKKSTSQSTPLEFTPSDLDQPFQNQKNSNPTDNTNVTSEKGEIEKKQLVLFWKLPLDVIYYSFYFSAIFILILLIPWLLNEIKRIWSIRSSQEAIAVLEEEIDKQNAEKAQLVVLLKSDEITLNESLEKVITDYFLSFFNMAYEIGHITFLHSADPEDIVHSERIDELKKYHFNEINNGGKNL